MNINISVYKEGRKMGYVRSVSYKTGKFSLVETKDKAKKFATIEMAQNDVDAMSNDAKYVFVIDGV